MPTQRVTFTFGIPKKVNHDERRAQLDKLKQVWANHINMNEELDISETPGILTVSTNLITTSLNDWLADRFVKAAIAQDIKMNPNVEIFHVHTVLTT